ncbi:MULTISPECIES: hypothetical protein [unclassified Brevundimonas]|uniref:hypothetical protein n=1 Tax=unclassified Brevundimonas TaxID=2622653 RepID=UPI003F932108
MFMILVASLAVLTLDPTAASASRPAVPPSTAIAPAPTVPSGEPMREVCRRERTPGSNLSERVCRQVPVNSAARDRSAGDRLRESQGSRTPQSF